VKDPQRRARYQQFVEAAQAPLFLNAWWLDIMAGAGLWDAAFAEKGASLTGVMPYVKHKKGRFTFLGHPPLTPYLGPWLYYPPGQKLSSRYSYHAKIVAMLTENLPRYHKALFSASPLWEDGLPLIWNGFSLAPRYTFILNPPQPTGNDAPEELLFSAYEGAIRRQINKARKALTIEQADTPDVLFHLLQHTFKRKQKALPVSEKKLHQLWRALRARDSGYLIQARHETHGVVAAMLIVTDNHYHYYLLGGNHTQWLHLGGASFLMHHAITTACRKGLPFNFEGSMYPDIARFFRSFGAEARPYIQYRRVNALLLKLVNCIK